MFFLPWLFYFAFAMYLEVVFNIGNNHHAKIGKDGIFPFDIKAPSHLLKANVSQENRVLCHVLYAKFMIQSHAESMKKIVGAVWDLPSK